MRTRWSRVAWRARAAVSRDGLRHRAVDEQRQLELCQIMWTMRHVVLVLALVTGRLGVDSAHDRWLVAGALLWQIPAHAIVRQRRRLTRAVTLTDAAVLLGLSAAGLPPFLVLVMSVGVLGWAATFRPIAAAGAGVAVLASVALTYEVHGDDMSAGTGVGAFALLGGIFIIRTVRMNMGARRATEREQLTADGIDAILWEHVDPERPMSPDDLDPGMLSPGMKVSLAAERLLGHPVEAWLRPGFMVSITHPDDREGFRQHLRSGRDGSVTIRLRAADGDHRWMEYRSTRIADRANRHAFAVGVLLDRTEQVEAEREALAFGHLVAASPIGQVLLRASADGPVVEAMNQASQRLLGVTHDPVGLRLADVVDPAVDLTSLVQLSGPDQAGGATSSTEFCDPFGRVHQVTLRRLSPETCSIDFLDVTERVEANERLHRQARHDDLTGLPNRRAFLEALEERVAAGARECVVVIIDLDDFKDINDSLGHETGDQLLQRIGQTIVASVGATDVVARLGGDEFALLVCDTATDAAIGAVRRLVDTINQPILVGDLRLRVRASAGLVPVRADEGRDTPELMRCADVAMYLAKGRGTGVEEYDAETDGFDRERLELVTDLELALANDQLVLHYQPLVDVATGRVTGTEALARWNHPRLGVVPPDAFINLAEVSGQIRPLTRWVIRRALLDLLALGSVGADLDTSVNLSVRNLYEVDLVDWIAATLDELGIEPRRLVVEITESTVMDDQLAAIEVVEALRDLGVRTWIDDFGTGHSSFARLRSLPVAGVKIDRSFVTDSGASPNSRILLRSIVDLVSSLGLHTVAEGVEDDATLEFLRSIGCTTAQGFGLHRPMPFEALHDLLARLAVAAQPATV